MKDREHMDKDTFVTFDEYKKQYEIVQPETYEDKHKASLEIIARAEAIRKMDTQNPNNTKGDGR